MTQTARGPIGTAGGRQAKGLQPRETVWAVANAGFAARCLHVVADLGVGDLIYDVSVPIDVLASACAVNADALDRVLRLLAAHGIFERHRGGYRHTPASRLLRSDHPTSMRPFVQMAGCQ